MIVYCWIPILLTLYGWNDSIGLLLYCCLSYGKKLLVHSRFNFLLIYMNLHSFWTMEISFPNGIFVKPLLLLKKLFNLISSISKSRIGGNFIYFMYHDSLLGFQISRTYFSHSITLKDLIVKFLWTLNLNILDTVIKRLILVRSSKGVCDDLFSILKLYSKKC